MAGDEQHPQDESQRAAAAPVNPFHLAMAELQADQDPMEPPYTTAGAAPSPPSAIPQPSAPKPFDLRHPSTRVFIALVVVASFLSGIVGGIVSGSSGRRGGAGEQAAAQPPNLAPELKTVKDQVADLGGRIDALNKRLDDWPKPAPAPDLSGLREQVASLKTAAADAANLPARVDVLSRRAGELDQTVGTVHRQQSSLQSELATLRGELASLRKQMEKPPVETPRPSVSRPPAATSNPGAGSDAKSPLERSLAQGADLFRKGKYNDALRILNKLELSDPSDARVWYYSALCLGLATQEWTGGAEERVAKGIEREEAGTPPKSVIDAEFRDLTVPTGKTWLEGYRQRAKAQPR